MDVTLATWALIVGIILALLVLDLLTFSRHPHEVGFKEAAWWSVFYVVVSIVFGIWVWWDAGSIYGTEFFTASIYQQRVLLIGVILALIFRAIFIAIGAAALAYFAFTFVIFGAILIWTGVGLMRHWNEDPDPSDNLVVKFVKRRIPFTDDYHGTKLFIRENGQRLATPGAAWSWMPGGGGEQEVEHRVEL